MASGATKVKDMRNKNTGQLKRVVGTLPFITDDVIMVATPSVPQDDPLDKYELDGEGNCNIYTIHT